VGPCATYAHPIEDFFVNYLSTVIGPTLFPDHFITFSIFFALRLHETVDAHSGYNFPFSPWGHLPYIYEAERHDYHHSQQLGNYGGFTVWDWICGTDKDWKAFKLQKNRNPKITS